VHPDVKLFIQFGSQEVKQYCEENGYLALFDEMGAEIIEPGCGACIAAGPGTSKTKDEVTISSQNRNFPGRSGPGQLYLASPYTVAASAVAGYITEWQSGRAIRQLETAGACAVSGERSPTETLTGLLSALAAGRHRLAEPGAGARRRRARPHRGVLRGWLRARGVDAWTEEVAPGRCNAVARVGSGDTNAGVLVLCAHLDTVSAEGMTQRPFDRASRTAGCTAAARTT
jgi:hypothetical protein